MIKAPTNFEYEPWRHGGWYVHNVRYPSGAVGCVSKNYPDRQWRIVCDDRPNPPTFKSRDDAARAEWELAIASFRAMSVEEMDAFIAKEAKVFGRSDNRCHWLRKMHNAVLADAEEVEA